MVRYVYKFPFLNIMTTTHTPPKPRLRHLIVITGDQLDRESFVFDHFDPEQDALWMAENVTEATHVWCHKIRLAFFFSAMRHFARDQRDRGRTVHYQSLTPDASNDRGEDFEEILTRDLEALSPEKLIVCHPGDYRVKVMLERTAEKTGIPLEITEDRHFYCGIDEFAEFIEGRKTLIMETFYRRMRKQHGVLMTEDKSPVGGEWNFDKENRESFGKKGPPEIKRPRRFKLDPTTRKVMDMVESRFSEHPGVLDHFDLPVTRDHAMAYLRDFLEHRLPGFGTYEDAMWSGEPFLYHSRLSALLNVKLLSPRECVDKAVEAYHDGHAPINSVEAFTRQLLGWREFIRGVYWTHMPDYAKKNALECGERDVPGFFWDGETDMACAADAMRSVVRTAWNHHIPRLMVLGQFSLLLGVHPYKFHEWHMAMYVDAIDWVSLPNTLGMSQYGDGGVVGTKPYCASGNYIHRMGNYCATCRYNPKKATGDDACPFTTLYWDFLDRHYERFKNNRRMIFQIKNLERKSPGELEEIRERATHLRKRLDAGGRV